MRGVRSPPQTYNGQCRLLFRGAYAALLCCQCPCGPDGVRPPRRARLASGRDQLDCRQDRLRARDPARLGSPGRARSGPARRPDHGRARAHPGALYVDPMGTGSRLGRLRATISGSATMTQHTHITASHQLDYDRTLILAVEVSGRSWIVAAQVPGLRQKGVKQQLAPQADALMAAVEGYKRRAAAAGMAVDRVIVAYESGGGGVWLGGRVPERGGGGGGMAPPPGAGGSPPRAGPARPPQAGTPPRP